MKKTRYTEEQIAFALQDENQRLKKLVAIRPTGAESAHPQLYPRNGHDAG